MVASERRVEAGGAVAYVVNNAPTWRICALQYPPPQAHPTRPAPLSFIFSAKGVSPAGFTHGRRREGSGFRS